MFIIFGDHTVQTFLLDFTENEGLSGGFCE